MTKPAPALPRRRPAQRERRRARNGWQNSSKSPGNCLGRLWRSGFECLLNPWVPCGSPNGRNSTYSQRRVYTTAMDRFWSGRRDSNHKRSPSGWSATKTLEGSNWSGRRDSNPRPQPWQGCALPLSYARSGGPGEISRSGVERAPSIAFGGPQVLVARACRNRRRGPYGQPMDTRSDAWRHWA